MKHLYYLFLLFFVLSSVGFAQTPNTNGVLFVDKNVSGGNQSGDSWANAMPEAADAFKAAAQLNATQPGTVTQIWVAAGTYKPKYRPDNLNSTNLNDRVNTFLMVKDVKVYGGFIGTETTLSQRNLNLGQESILSGDLGIQGINSDNAFNVVVSIGNVGTAELNGLKVINGYGTIASITTNVNGYTIEHNNGAGMLILSSSPIVTNCKFQGSVAGTSGGGIFARNSSSIISNVIIAGNTAVNGGGLSVANNSNVNLTNATISGNKTVNGGGIYLQSVLNSPTLNVRNSVISGNQTGTFNSGGNLNIFHSLVEGIGANTTNSIINGSLDPLFAIPQNYNNAPFTNGLYTLQPTSPLIDSGSSSYYATGQNPNISNITTDIAGNPRNQLTTVDIGAYEYPTTYPAIIITSTKSDVLCNGAATGAINTTITGGIPPYDITWNTVPAQKTNNLANLKAGTYTITVEDAVNQVFTHTVTITEPNEISATATLTNIKCFGNLTGSIDLHPTGGTPPYTYNWSNNMQTEDLNNLSAGTYIVQIADVRGCTGTATFTLTEPIAALTINPSHTNVVCNGALTGSATVTVSGGTAPYTYSWNNGITSTTNEAKNLAAGTYEVTVTDFNNCVAQHTFTITQPTPITASVTKVNVTCNGSSDGSATVNASGGTGDLSYAWSTTPVQTTATATGLAAGTYKVTITDANGCTKEESVTIEQPAPIIASVAIVNVTCNGGNNGSATITANGGTGTLSYVWDSTPAQTTATATGLAAGTYKVTITDANGCTKEESVTIEQPTPITASVAKVNVTCNGGNNGSATVTANGGSGTLSYVWNTTPAQTTATATGLAAGTYKVTITDANGCTKEESVTIEQPTPITASVTKVNVSCNGGNNGSATVTANGGSGTLSYVWNTTPVQTTATATGLAAGNYIVTITDANGCTKEEFVTIGQPTPITASVAKVNVTCNGGNNGSATVTANGGTGTLSYVWNTTPVQTTATATGLAAGTYKVTITDANGCAKEESVTITQPTPITASVAKVNVTCNGGNNGSATVTASGGTGDLSYSWNTTPAQTTATATSLAAGTYKVTIIDANGCAKEESVTIEQSSSITASVAIVNVTCNGGNNGSATVTANGGTGTLSYVWNTTPVQTTATATGLAAGTYKVTITDANGCAKEESVTITQPTPITASVAKVNVTCNGGNNGSATVTASGGTGDLSYSWNTTPAQTTATATGLAAGNYIVTITDANGCTKEEFVTIGQPTPITASVAKVNVTCNGGNNGSATVTANGGTGTLSYVWNTTPVQTTATATGLAAGNYIVTITDANGCTKEVTVEIIEPEILNIVPTQINLLCSGSSTGSASVAVTGGTTPYQYVWSNGITSTTNVAENLSTGTYTVTVTDANGCTITETFIFKETSSIVLDPSQENVKCNGTSTGSATVVASGGIAPYQYIWNNGITSTTHEAKDLAAGTYEVTVIDANNCKLTHTFIITEPTELVINPNQVDVACNGTATGYAKVDVTGGVGPYTYNWNNGVTSTINEAENLAAGIYEVTVTDSNSCVVKHTFTITQPTALNINADQVNVLCNGSLTGSATVTVSGGTAPYTYSWNNGITSTTNEATNLTAGTYEVTVTDSKNCSITHTFTITEPKVLNVSATQVNVLCNGNLTGSASVEVTGGTAPFNYVWDNGITSTTNEAKNLAVGTYKVTITDANNCKATHTFVITEPDALTIDSTQQNVVCNGDSSGSATVSVAGGVAPYTYVWNNGISSTTNEATNLAAGTYEVTVTDFNGCTITEIIEITELSRLTIDPAQENILCNGSATGSASVTVSGGEAPYEYVWSNGISSITNEATNLVAGTYEVTVTDVNGCSVSHTFNITEPLVLVSKPTQQNILCFGETTGSALVEISGGVAPYQYVWNNGITSTTNQAINLAAGTYEVLVTDANGCTLVEQFLITEPTAIQSTSSQINVNCNASSTGFAKVEISGGTAPYNYSWSTGITSTTNEASNLTAGTYEVIVTDANGCKISETFVITEPSAIIATTSKIDVACNGGKTGEASVTASGGTGILTYEWNTNPVQTTATAVGLNAGTYTVIITDENGCFTTETVSINEPAAIDPPVATDQFYCGAANTTIADLAASGINVQWYDVAVGGKPLNPTTIVTTGTYYATQTINGCESNTRKAVQVTITITPEPTASNQSFCMTDNATISDLIAVGTNLKWYSTRTSMVPLNPSDLLTTGTYFVTQTLNGCESLVRTAVEVTIHNTPTPIAVDQVFCFTSNATVANIVASGSNIQWYNVATGGTPLSATTPLTNGTYYASQTIDGCESSIRKMVTITITQPVPLTTTQLTVCNNTRVQNMMIEGLNYTQLKWYDSATSTTPLVSSMLLTSTTYYVSTFVDACESIRQPIQITVAPIVPAPTAVFQSVCTGTVLNDLVVGKNPAATLNWFASAQSMIPIAGTTIVSTGTYYVQQVLDGCESERIPVQVQVIYLTEPTIFTLTLCEGTTVGSLNTGNTNYVWYTDNTTQTPLPDTYVITSGNYYIANKVQNCVSGRKMIATNVSARPASPTGQSKQSFDYKATVANIKMNEPNVIWFASYEDAVAQVNALSSTDYLTDGATYYGILIGQNNCGSLIPTAVEVTINLSNQELDLAKLKYYPNPTDSYLTISYIEDITKVELYAITGQRVLSVTNESKEIMVDLRNLSSGTYLVKIQTATASQFIKVIRK